MAARDWISQVMRDKFWEGWRRRFKHNSNSLITPNNEAVQGELSKFDWSESGSDEAKAERAWLHVYDTIDYRLSSKWYRPNETLSNRRGDCEDLTFLLASMFSAMGVEDHSIRTGYLVKPNGMSGEHVWNQVGDMTVDGTGLPQDVPEMEYRSNYEFVIKEG